jgi:hypothetical protein
MRFVMYAAIRKYSVRPQSMSEVIQRIQGEFLHIISREYGFTAYYALQTEHDELLTFSAFATRAGAEGSTPLAHEWVKQKLAGFIQGEPETTVGWIFGSSFGPSSNV